MQMKETFHEFVSSINWTEPVHHLNDHIASILDRLTKNAVRFQIPIGEEENHGRSHRPVENEGILF
jgi:hypothetical protein